MKRNWIKTRRACPECGSAVEKAPGPDFQLAVRCTACDYSDVFAVAADEYITDLDRLDTDSADVGGDRP